MFRINVYRLCNFKDYQIYIGSTKRKLRKRLLEHFRLAKYGNDKLLSQHIRDLGRDSFYMQVLEIRLVKNKKDQLKIEQKWKNIFNPSLNCLNCVTTEEEKKSRQKQWSIKNKEKISKRAKDWGYGYRDRNRQHLQQKRSSYYQANKDKEKRMHQEYVDRNRDKIRKYDREWRKKNKDRLANKRKMKTLCECGSSFRKSDRAKHLRTEKHQIFVKFC